MPIRVVHVCTSDAVGGAARAARRLHEGLRQLGDGSVVSRMLVANRSSVEPSITQYHPGGSLVNKLERRRQGWLFKRELSRATRHQSPGDEYFCTDRSAHGNALHQALGQCDIVNLHWVSGLLDYPTFFPAVAGRTPIVWTLHDMNAMTGGCHYDDGCRRWEAGCRQCPQLQSQRADDLSARTWRSKQKVFGALADRALHLVTPSRWLGESAARSALLGRFARSLIPYGIETDAFVPIDRPLCRAALGIPSTAKVLLFVAQSLQVRRKGFASLEPLLKRLGSSDLFVLSVGAGPAPLPAGTRHLHLGNVQSERLLSLAYGAAELLIIPSTQDNLPNTVLEAMACGTPSAGFAVGGIPDIIRPGETGLLAPAGDVDSLAQQIDRLLADATLGRQLARRCREIAVAEYALAVQARRYADLYHKLLCN